MYICLCVCLFTLMCAFHVRVLFKYIYVHSSLCDVFRTFIYVCISSSMRATWREDEEISAWTCMRTCMATCVWTSMHDVTLSCDILSPFPVCDGIFFFWCILLGIKGRRPRRVTYQAWETSSLHPDVCESLMSCSKLARMLGCLRVNTGGLHCYTFLSSFMPGQASMTRRMSEQNRMLSGCLTTCHFMRVTPPMITPNWL